MGGRALSRARPLSPYGFNTWLASVVAHALRMLAREDDLDAAWEHAKVAYGTGTLMGALNDPHVVVSFLEALSQGSAQTIGSALSAAEQHYRVLTATGGADELGYSVALTVRATRAAIELKLDAQPGTNALRLTANVVGATSLSGDNAAWEFEKVSHCETGRVILPQAFTDGPPHLVRFIARLAVGSIIANVDQHVAHAAQRDGELSESGEDIGHSLAQERVTSVLVRFAAELLHLPEDEWIQPWAGNGVSALDTLKRLARATDSLELDATTPAELVKAIAGLADNGRNTIYT